ncbi:MAG: transcription-repair coupling factor [Spirochaetia bacterium]|nr:transcription-repair coupling factor [Spirochaetia bacterium]
MSAGIGNLRVFGIEGYPLAQLVRLAYRSQKGKIWVICPTKESCLQMLKDLGITIDSYGNIARDLSSSEVPVVYFPGTDKKLYSPWQPGPLEYMQLQVLTRIREIKEAIIVTHLRPFVSSVVASGTIEASSLKIKVGGTFDPVSIAARLSSAGYTRGPSTQLPGDFSVRGEVLDIFPFNQDEPVRIYSAWNEVEKIAPFDPLTQETSGNLRNFAVSLVDETSPVETCLIDSYVGSHDFFCLLGDLMLDTSYKSLQAEAKSLYRTAFQEDRNCPRPDEILLDFPDFVSRHPHSLTLVDIDNDKECYRFNLEGPHSYFGDFSRLKGELKSLSSDGWQIFISSGNALQTQRLKQMLSSFPQIRYMDVELSGGFSIPERKVIVLCEHEIFGRRKQVIKTLRTTKSSPLDSFVDLHEGDYVVHVNYGVGRFIKIDRVKSFDRERDYIKIAYAGGDTIYVPIEQANLVQRYIGSSGSAPTLDRIGTASWEKKKAKARAKAEDLAKYLIELYARRKATIGFPFEPDNDMQLQFEAMFPYEETPDQLTCIDDVKADMESSTAMDRLICGDVGFGKTEVAFRAAFKAVMSGKQVAFLAPTTILAEQHYNNFIQRCQDFPINIGLLSRVVPKKQQTEVKNRIAGGQIDVLFGTHRILQKDILFRDLGLLVIDEEQRFGVKDKEKIKKMRTSIDSLALSATPIPRTLYMSLLKIRDMSLLTTPPMARHAIATKIIPFDISVAAQAIRDEIARHGQVFYLHNRIDSLDATVRLLSQLLPDVAIASAHGQMEPADLEDTMRRFIHEGIQVLVSTTIIENGIDIPNVNTIIIDRADLYGISQLYQLRGRVGRSDHQAYAYLFYPNEQSLSEVAVKRLRTISENTGLGAGFKVSMKDMEIRGAGNLLGREQSGQLASVGLDMYIRILDEAVNKIRSEGKEELEQEVFMELDYTGFIPDSYIKEPSIKFEIYKKIASVQDRQQLNLLISELSDRFGPPPEEVSNLIYIAQLKIVCRKLGIIHLKEKKGTVTVTYRSVKYIHAEKLLALLKYSNGNVKFDTAHPCDVKLRTGAVSLKDKSLFILEMLERLA